ncbi:hypothetical protein BJF83_23975 [Nocardiopsis sp. CNR-923]|uniref:hypothetical protein n=1 Tax=Nocardiopsis sp. CNR-923 TaxID=1904965 RepID=UPI00095EB928|nr:hypothetical protein [Nocardiopsis sp. CNR-923]OLT24695.1 hypothetical protein BJF83_23975 [Nocardiopsis sp. CNR-923]
MAGNPPYLLIDVDGVLNPFPGPGGSVPPEYHPHRVDFRGHHEVPVWLNPHHGATVNALHSMGLVRPRWATSWGAEANRLIAPHVGMPHLPHIDLGALDISTPHPRGYLWKRDPVADWLGDAPVAWIDDDFAPPDYDWAAERTLRGAPTLLIQPDPYVGLRRHHIAAVRLWAISVTRDHDTFGNHHERPLADPQDPVVAHAQRGPCSDRP